MSRTSSQAAARPPILADELVRLAAFRMLLRQFESFSAQASADLGLTSVQYQALLAIETQQDGVQMTVKLLAQQLMIKHNSAVGLVDRIEHLGLAVRRPSASDGRSVVVALTARGRRAVGRLALEHRNALQAIAPVMGSYMRHFAKQAAAPAVQAAPKAPRRKPAASARH